MRTKEMHLSAFFLSLLIAGSGGLSAQEIPVPTVAPEAPAAPQAPEPPANQGRVFTGDQTVAAGESVDGLVVVGGDLRVQGEVRGDAVVVNGDLFLSETGMVLGDAVVTGGELVNEGGRVRGEMRTVDADEPGGQGVSVAPRGAVQTEARSTRRAPRDGFWFDPIRRGMAGIISTLALGLVLAGVGAAVVFYARPYLETVSDTVRGATVRAGLTGLAASFLAIPAFVVLIVALAVSIIGIPFLLIAVPLYPVAIFAAGMFGLLSVSHAIGERTAEQSRDALDLRYRNSYAYLFTGLGMLLLPHLAAHLISMTGFLGFIGTLLRVITWLAIWVAATVGFGAVILSRAGRRRTFVAPSPDVGYDAGDIFDEDPLGGAGHA
jgi:hypothetical protein